MARHTHIVTLSCTPCLSASAFDLFIFLLLILLAHLLFQSDEPPADTYATTLSISGSEFTEEPGDAALLDTAVFVRVGLEGRGEKVPCPQGPSCTCSSLSAALSKAVFSVGVDMSGGLGRTVPLRSRFDAGILSLPSRFGDVGDWSSLLLPAAASSALLLCVSGEDSGLEAVKVCLRPLGFAGTWAWGWPLEAMATDIGGFRGSEDSWEVSRQGAGFVFGVRVLSTG